MAKGKKKQTDFYPLKHLKEIESEKYNEESYLSKISSEKTETGYSGIRIRTASKQPYFREQRPGIWLPSRINLSKWFNWFSITVTKLIYRLWGKEIEGSPEQVKAYGEKIQELNAELTETNIKLKSAEEKLSQNLIEIELAKEVIDKLEAYEAALIQLEAEIKRSISSNRGLEASVKNKIKENRWILGLDCQVKAAEKKISKQLAIDLHIKTNFSEDKIFEFKSPNLQPFQKKNRLFITPDLAQGLNQLILYMTTTDTNSKLRETKAYKIQSPSGIIVIGYNLDNQQKRLLTEWNFHLAPHIRIITYNELLEKGKLQLENIRLARKKEIEKIKQ